MADRVLIWHIPHPGEPLPVFYADRDYEPVALRIYAERAPDAGDLLVDVLADGVSIMNANDLPTMSLTQEQAYIEMGTKTLAFTLNETITGGTSAATARVVGVTVSRLTLDNPSANFTAAETVTGGTSGATATVTAYVRARNERNPGVKAGQSHATLRKNGSSESVAQDFKDRVQIGEGSWISLSVLDLAGAGNVTVQLELEALGIGQEARIRAEGR